MNTPDWAGAATVVTEMEPMSPPAQTAAVTQLRPAADDSAEWWYADWQGMPEFVMRDLKPWKSVKVHFASEADMKDFARLVGQRVPGMGPGGSIWYPPAKVGHFADKRYLSDPHGLRDSIEEAFELAYEDGAE